jgi:hypothetical protein
MLPPALRGDIETRATPRRVPVSLERRQCAPSDEAVVAYPVISNCVWYARPQGGRKKPSARTSSNQ